MTPPKGCYIRIAPRSGLALKKGIQIGAGVIDPDYTGEIGVVVFNQGKDNFEVRPGDKIAQIILEQAKTPPIKV
jgi:dUTP pyrophosphatase